MEREEKQVIPGHLSSVDDLQLSCSCVNLLSFLLIVHDPGKVSFPLSS